MHGELGNGTDITDLPDDLHAHADGRVAVAPDEAQVRLAHQALMDMNIICEMSKIKYNMCR